MGSGRSQHRPRGAEPPAPTVKAQRGAGLGASLTVRPPGRAWCCWLGSLLQAAAATPSQPYLYLGPAPWGAGVPAARPSSKFPSGRGSWEGAGLHNLLVTWWRGRAQEPSGFGDPHGWEWGVTLRDGDGIDFGDPNNEGGGHGS